jgi:hypothetical protein
MKLDNYTVCEKHDPKGNCNHNTQVKTTINTDYYFCVPINMIAEIKTETENIKKDKRS